MNWQRCDSWCRHSLIIIVLAEGGVKGEGCSLAAPFAIKKPIAGRFTRRGVITPPFPNSRLLLSALLLLLLLRPIDAPFHSAIKPHAQILRRDSGQLQTFRIPSQWIIPPDQLANPNWRAHLLISEASLLGSSIHSLYLSLLSGVCQCVPVCVGV